MSVIFNNKKEDNDGYFSKKEIQENIDNAKKFISEKKYDQNKEKNVSDVMMRLNNKEDIFIKGENGSGKSLVVETALKHLEKDKKIKEYWLLVWYFIVYFFTRIKSKTNADIIKNKILVRRQKKITINLWSLFSLKSVEDYPCDNTTMKTAGVHINEKNDKLFSTYDSPKTEIISEKKLKDGKVTHLYIKRMLWGTIMNSLSPNFKNNNLEKILHRETFHKGPTFLGVWLKIFLLVMASLVILVGVPILVYLIWTNGGKNPGNPTSNIIKIIVSASLDVPIGILAFVAKKFISKSEIVKINELLIDQSNNIFISNTLNKKTKFKIINIHFEDLDRLEYWLNNSTQCKECEGLCSRTQIIQAIIMNINLMYMVDNIRIITEVNDRVIEEFKKYRKNNDNTKNDYIYKTFNEVVPIKSPSQDAISKWLLKNIPWDEYEIKNSNWKDISKEKIVDNITNVYIGAITKDESSGVSWRKINSHFEIINNFIKKYNVFLKLDNFNFCENWEFIFKKELEDNDVFNNEVTKENILENKKLNSALQHLSQTMPNIKVNIEKIIHDTNNEILKIRRGYVSERRKQMYFISWTHFLNIEKEWLDWLLSKSLLMNLFNVYYSLFESDFEKNNMGKSYFKELREQNNTPENTKNNHVKFVEMCNLIINSTSYKKYIMKDFSRRHYERQIIIRKEWLKNKLLCHEQFIFKNYAETHIKYEDRFLWMWNEICFYFIFDEHSAADFSYIFSKTEYDKEISEDMHNTMNEITKLKLNFKTFSLDDSWKFSKPFCHFFFHEHNNDKKKERLAEMRFILKMYGSTHYGKEIINFKYACKEEEQKNINRKYSNLMVKIDRVQKEYEISGKIRSYLVGMRGVIQIILRGKGICIHKLKNINDKKDSKMPLYDKKIINILNELNSYLNNNYSESEENNSIPLKAIDNDETIKCWLILIYSLEYPENNIHEYSGLENKTIFKTLLKLDVEIDKKIWQRQNYDESESDETENYTLVEYGKYEFFEKFITFSKENKK